MAQKLLEPLRKLPQQFQNLGLIQKIHDLTFGKPDGSFGNCLSSTYGCYDCPTAVAFDNVLGLLAVGMKNGIVKVYGTSGIAFTLNSAGGGAISLEFCTNEGRLIVACEDGCIELHELDAKVGGWKRCSRLRVLNPDCEAITCVTLSVNIVYVGSSVGTLRQVARDGNRLCLGDDSLTSCTSAMVVETIPSDKRSEIQMDSPIVSLAMQPGGNHLLIAYANGAVAVAIPQPLTSVTAIGLASVEAAPTAEVEPTTPSTEECPRSATLNLPQSGNPETTGGGQSSVNEQNQAATMDAPKEGTEKRATLKLKEFARSLRGGENIKLEPELEPVLPVPPAPKISHLLIRDQTVESASWCSNTVGDLSTEVVVAYADGAFQIWPIVAAADQNPPEPILVSKRDPPSTPYGPLPCGSIKKILMNPGHNGAILTAFSGGLPRPEFQDRHAVTIMQGQEHHVCFQFGSAVIDFLFVPQKDTLRESSTEESLQHSCSFSAAALVVLTERELLAIDLMQPDWPVFQFPYLNCLNLSPVTALAYLTQVPTSLLPQINSKENPVWGGFCEELIDRTKCDVSVLGHANGWISLFAINKGDCAYHIASLRTASLFAVEDSTEERKCTVEEETWPPFRRVGYCALNEDQLSMRSDPRLAVTNIEAYIQADGNCGDSESINIVVGGAGGHVSLWTVTQGDLAVLETDVVRIHANLMEIQPPHTNYEWKGGAALEPAVGAQQFDSAGIIIRPRVVIQLHPPAPVTSIAWENSWKLLAIGSPHGFALIDLFTNSTVHGELFDMSVQNKVTQAVMSVQRELVSRGKQITASMRRSFRRLKHLGTSSIAGNKSLETTNEARSTSQPTDEHEGNTDQNNDSKGHEPTEPGDNSSDANVAPVKTNDSEEVKLEGDNSTSTIPTTETVFLLPEEGPSTVRSLLFAETYLLSTSTADLQQTSPECTPSLWVGTANGRAIAYILKWDGPQDSVKVQLVKELRLRHQAPIIKMCVIDAVSRSPILCTSHKRGSLDSVENEVEAKPGSNESKAEESVVSNAGDATGSTQTNTELHYLLVCSEVQVKIFCLPTLRALCKHKFVERIRLPYGVGHLTLTPDTLIDKPTGDVVEHRADSAISEDKVQSTTHHHRKALSAVGIQCFDRGSTTESKLEWVVVAVRRDCKGSILSLPNLRQLFKVRALVDATASPTQCVPSLSSARIILWHSGSQLFAQELSQIPRLLSPACICANGLPPVTIPIPKWARMSEPAPSEATREQSNPLSHVQSESQATEVHETVEASSSLQRTATEQIPKEVDEKIPDPKTHSAVVGSVNAGDLTIDSIKEYLNDDESVTVKTFESSSEKHTVVQGGRIVTTLHETEKVDGKIVKDDIVKLSSDGDPVPGQIVGST